MPNDLISCFLLICQRAMQEKDGVYSAFRIVDIFFVDPIAEVPLERQAVQLTFLGSVRGYPGDATEHTVSIRLIRPDGDVTVLNESKATLEAKEAYRDLPRGLNVVGEIGVIPKQMGTHYITLTLDGEEVTRVPFTLRARAEADEKN